MQNVLVALVFVLLCGLGGWYLAHPDSWNKRDLIQSTDTTARRIELEPSAPPEVNIPIIEGQGDAACKAPSTSAVNRNESRIYRWTDADGQTHFSDNNTDSPSAELYNANQIAELDYFDLAISYRGQKTVPFLQGQLSAQATGIYEILARLVGIGNLRHVQLDIVIFPDAGSFRQYARAAGNDSQSFDGYYSARTNEAVTYTAADDNRTMEVARHEATHVIAHGVFGTMPVWLNEGLAEYFEKLTIRGQLTEVEVYEGWPDLARASVSRGYPRSFANFLNLSHNDWHGSNESTHYALSWSLIYFMMGSDPGRQTLASLMQQMAGQYCQPLDSADVLAQLYPGGLNALEKHWHAWLEDDAIKASHIY